ncbi:MAG: DNA-formamidopyrimidine glycosylase family protein [Gammaproteobacteria bacterium]|nr:DNA-formamidopyrimidine glycosylase family protein [Gammaproteobacteria bacterium]
MPEGDTVFKLATYLQPVLRGHRLHAGSEICERRTRLDGRVVGDVFAHGKHLFIALDDRYLLRSHLGMWGTWHSYAAHEEWQKPRRQASVVLRTDARTLVCFNAREIELLRSDGLRRRDLADHLGPDLLATTPDLDDMLRRARLIAGPADAIADVLLNQRIATGIGNVYKSETLFVCGVHPLTPLHAVTDDVLEALFATAAALLGRNTVGGPRQTRRANDEAGMLWVYGRTGRPCLRCDTVVRSARLGVRQRSTFWCPACQRQPADAVRIAGH